MRKNQIFGTLTERKKLVGHILANKAIEVAANAEKHRPTCSRCGTGLRFGAVQYLDNSPMRDSLFSSTLAVLPAVCPSCGKYEFYDPEIAERNEYLQHLIKQDKAE